MSLDVYLTMPGGLPEADESAGRPRIFVREDGQVKEVSREEWDEKFPGREPVVVTGCDPEEVYSANITHNLGQMADEAGIYKALWRPEEMGFTKAKHLIQPLRIGLDALRSDPVRFKAHNPANGRGDYEGLVRFTELYLAACERYPEADVRVRR